MKALPLDDPRWAQLKSAYRITYDARPLLQRFEAGQDMGSCWEELWNELHHQGDVDTATYAVLPHLVSFFSRKSREWDLYAFAATVAVEAGDDKNPPVPDHLRDYLREALDDLFEMALIDLKASGSLSNLRAILSFLACHKGSEVLSRALLNIDLFEDYGEEILTSEKLD